MPFNRPSTWNDLLQERSTHERSVIDRYHPDNIRNDDPNDRDYVFRQRNVSKLNLTLGWELEANHVANRLPNGVEQTGDGSVNGDEAEYVVLPAITKSPRYVLGLLKELVHAPNLNTDESCGFHVHVSASNIPLSRMRQWALATEHLAMRIEDLAFKAVPDSRKDNQYCKRIQPLFNGARFVSSKHSNSRRYNWLNTVEMFRPNGIRTMENRLLGHTHRWKYVLAWTLFTMELAAHGWEIAHKPFDIDNHVAPLEGLLKDIITEIKPLDRRHEPIPQWIYKGLAKHGIESATWERPLAKLVDREYELKGIAKPFYSDSQVEIPNRDREEDNDYCPCGCETEGRCYSQIHADGDCESNDCEYCHDGGNCDGLPHCRRCVQSAHDNDEDCQRVRCGSCRPVTQPVTPTPLPVTYNGSNVTFNVSRVTTARFEPLTATGMRAAVDSIRQMNAVQSDNLAMSLNPVFYGRSIPEVIQGDIERQANQMLDNHEAALSVDREHYQFIRVRGIL